jgi:hypothetical protein
MAKAKGKGMAKAKGKGMAKAKAKGMAKAKAKELAKGKNHKWASANYSADYGTTVYSDDGDDGDNGDDDGDDDGVTLYYWCKPDNCGAGRQRLLKLLEWKGDRNCHNSLSETHRCTDCSQRSRFWPPCSGRMDCPARPRRTTRRKHQRPSASHPPTGVGWN